MTSPAAFQVDKHYDLIILGTGSGNSIPGPEFDGKSIAIIEKGAFGGTCLNVGWHPHQDVCLRRRCGSGNQGIGPAGA